MRSLDPRQFLTAPEVTKFEIQESGTVVGQENVLTIRLVSNVPLFQGLTLSLSRLVGRADACVGESSVTSASRVKFAKAIWSVQASFIPPKPSLAIPLPTSAPHAVNVCAPRQA